MVTANRMHLAQRAVKCFLDQDYPNKELIVVDDGTQDYAPIFKGIPAADLTYIKIPNHPKNNLGKLRNLALDSAKGDFLAQWDDDDWYHPHRISTQSKALADGADACCLSATLMHIDDPDFFHLPYSGALPNGVPGSIMHRNDPEIRYPEFPKAEDTVFLKAWMNRKYVKLPENLSHLFIRCFHGSNTWEMDHFRRRMRNNIRDLAAYGFHRYIKRDLSGHPRFLLGQDQKNAFEMYLKDSRDLNIFKNQA